MKLPLVLCFRRFAPQKNSHRSCNREHSTEGAVLVAGWQGQQLADGHIKMGSAGVLHKSHSYVAHPADRIGPDKIGLLAGIGARPLNLELPQSERIRRGNARSLPKNNYTSRTTLKFGQETGPAGCGAVTETAAGVKVVGDADV
jgi:hypothetical protein